MSSSVITRTTTNSYFANGRTYKPLYTYYLPIGFTAAAAYYSLRYHETYYDGYGYNFYYGQYAYYEDSPNDSENMGYIIAMSVCTGCMFPLLICIKYCCRPEKDREAAIEKSQG